MIWIMVILYRNIKYTYQQMHIDTWLILHDIPDHTRVLKIFLNNNNLIFFYLNKHFII